MIEIDEGHISDIRVWIKRKDDAIDLIEQYRVSYVKYFEESFSKTVFLRKFTSPKFVIEFGSGIRVAYIPASEVTDDVDLTMNHLAPGRPWKFKKEKPIRLGITFEDASGSLDVKPKSPKVALQLFAALEVVFKKMISETEHDFIMFTGDSQHQRLYDVLAKRISKMGSYVNKSQLGDVNQYILIKKGVE